jgi:hypothetical protein
VANERRDITGKQTLGELAHHGMLNVGFGEERAIDELPVSGSPGEDSATLKPGDDRRDRRLRQLSAGVQLLPDLGNSELSLLPEEAQDGNLELGKLLTISHMSSALQV